MTNINDIIKTIDTSKMERRGASFYEMCESEFEIYEWLEQPKDNERLTYCYYHRWICTDTEVGIRVWYLDNEPVCISWQPYRKSNETFGWISKEKFNEVRNYALSLKDDNLDVDIVDDETINNVVEKFNSIDYKKFEERNVAL
jgi:hypothetical protein